MVFILPIIILAAIAASYASLIWAWGILFVAIGILYFQLFQIKQIEWKDIPELSPSANAMFKVFGHFFTMREIAAPMSSSASFAQIASLIIACIGVFKSSWFGIPLAVVLQPVLISVAKQFNPTKFLKAQAMIDDYNEIVHVMNERNLKKIREKLSNS